MGKATSIQLNSMTGFGSCSLEVDGITLEVEIRSVNSRFLDCVFRIPRLYNSFEPELRSLLSDSFQRGRIEIQIFRKVSGDTVPELKFQQGLFDAYYNLFDELKSDGKVSSDAAKDSFVSELLLKRDVVEVSEETGDIEAEKSTVIKAVKAAVKELLEMRKAEGEKLCAELLSRHTSLETLLKRIDAHSESESKAAQTRLRERVTALCSDIELEQTRLFTEVALLADKLDITEELVRIKSHLAQFKQTMSADPCGRKLEFILQELGREFNTIGSKIQSSSVQALVVDGKADLEKMREQIQNVQ